MVQRKIMLNMYDVKEFVEVTRKCDFDVDISYNRYVVDAKSILGVYCLDLTKVLTVSYNGYNAEFEAFLAQLALAC